VEAAQFCGNSRFFAGPRDFAGKREPNPLHMIGPRPSAEIPAQAVIQSSPDCRRVLDARICGAFDPIQAFPQAFGCARQGSARSKSVNRTKFEPKLANGIVIGLAIRNALQCLIDRE
jgi:hypothetical protein